MRKEKAVVATLILCALIFNHLQFILDKIATPAGTIYLGTVHFPADYFYYLSQLAQGKMHFLTSTILYTAEKLPPVLVGWQTVLVGRIFSTLNIGVIASYQLSLLIYSLINLILVYKLLSEFFKKEVGKRVLAFFIFLTSTSLPKLISTNGTTVWSYYYIWNHPGNHQVRLGATPHHKLAELLFVTGVLLVIYWLKNKSVNIKHVIGLALVGLMLVSITPVHWGLLVLTTFVVSLLLGFSPNLGNLIRKRVMQVDRAPDSVDRKGTLAGGKPAAGPALILFISGLPAAIYVRHVFNLPPYNLSSIWEASQQVNVNIYTLVLGSGLVIPFAILGVVAQVKKLKVSSLFGLVLIAIASLFYFTNIPYKLHLTNARFWPAVLYIFWAAFTSAGIFWLAEKAKRFSKVVLVLLISIYIASVVPTHIVQYSQVFKSKLPDPYYYYYLTNDAMNAFKEAEKISTPDSLFLVQSPYHWSFPALTGRKSFFGYELFTIDAQTKNQEAFGFFGEAMGEEEMRKLLKKYGIDYIFVTSSNSQLVRLSFVEKFYQNSVVTLFKVKN